MDECINERIRNRDLLSPSHYTKVNKIRYYEYPSDMIFATHSLIILWSQQEIKSHTTMETEKRCNARPNVLRRIPLHGVSPEDDAQDSFTITTKLENESDYDHCRCVICLESYEVGDKISWARNSMYCNHSFHPACIKQWLLKKRSCPCCRYGIIRWDDMFFRLNAWSDFCCGRRPRVLSDKLHRELLTRCRDSGEYCREHGLLFPFVPPLLEEPYEPRISELLECVKIVKVFEARMAAEKSGSRDDPLRRKPNRVDDKPRSGEQQNPSPHFPVQLRIVGRRDSAPPGVLELANIDSVSEVSRLTNTREEDAETSHRLPYSRNEDVVDTLRPQESIEDAAGVAAIDEALSFSESQ